MTAGSPWFRATNLPDEPEPQPTPSPDPASGPAPGPAHPAAQPLYEAETAVYEAIPGPDAYQGVQAVQQPQGAYTAPQDTYPDPQDAYTAAQDAYAAPPDAYVPAQETYAAPPPGPSPAPYEQPQEPDDGTMALRTVEPAAAPPPGPGRAERRRAAKRKGRGAAPEPAAPAQATAPLSRVEARRAARAAKDSVGVVLSRVVGELFITFGVVMLLFVTYQLWWTNVRAGHETDKAKEKIENSWSQEDRKPGAFEPGEGFALMYIPKLDVVVPVAEGIDKNKVLDKGMVGHYAEGRLKTAMPADKQGNFAVAGHRNTHGEPFRYINRLVPGDPIVVETRDAYYTYEMASILPQTAPSNVAVIDPVPKGSGFTKPGRYITLTTCTPEFTSTYRMIVWGKLVEERPRSKGKPDALVG
ncbi:class E sortase [Streptomyces sp. NPDC006339]|uniref:class E sortase n=1 Tax=Streptomyces sp. NPDC006339 TaxID=3156755 RepID=UPI0033BE135A